MLKIESADRGSKVHAVNQILEDGTKVTECGMSIQTPFKSSMRKNCCYGPWKITKAVVTCKKCQKLLAT